MLRKGFALAALGLAFIGGPTLAATSQEEPKAVHWSFEGPLGKFDQAQLQRGYKVYREVCSACHSMNLMSFRNLGQKGGPFFDPEVKNPNDNPYVKSIAKDYEEAPKGMAVPTGKYYNPYMPGDVSGFWSLDPNKVPIGGFIAMPPPLAPDKVTFDDGTKSTVDQQAKDVVAFLTWVSDPKTEERKSFGLAVMIYLLIFSGLLYASYRRIWANVSH